MVKPVTMAFHIEMENEEKSFRPIEDLLHQSASMAIGVAHTGRSKMCSA